MSLQPIDGWLPGHGRRGVSSSEVIFPPPSLRDARGWGVRRFLTIREMLGCTCLIQCFTILRFPVFTSYPVVYAGIFL